MYEREKLNSAEDQNSMLAGMTKGVSEKLNDDFDMDDMMITKAARYWACPVARFIKYLKVCFIVRFFLFIMSKETTG